MKLYVQLKLFLVMIQHHLIQKKNNSNVQFIYVMIIPKKKLY